MAGTNHRDGGFQPSRCSKTTIAMIEKRMTVKNLLLAANKEPLSTNVQIQSSKRETGVNRTVHPRIIQLRKLHHLSSLMRMLRNLTCEPCPRKAR
jgi:hypothetical protein